MSEYESGRKAGEVECLVHIREAEVDADAAPEAEDDTAGMVDNGAAGRRGVTRTSGRRGSWRIARKGLDGPDTLMVCRQEQTRVDM